jgi:hypothetical protein
MVMPESKGQENHFNASKMGGHCNTYNETSNNNGFEIYHQNIVAFK